MIIEKGEMWAGSATSLSHVGEAYERLHASMAAGNLKPEAFVSSEDDEGGSGLEVTQNGTAIIPIKGALVNRDLPEFIARFLGVTTYPQLQRQFAAATEDPTVKRVLLDVNSGGGSVAGLDETSEALANLKAAKPVSAFASTSCGSAAYWLASQATTLAAADMAELGSIGVIAVHMEVKDSYEREGLKPTVFRSGEKKHLGHEMETLTEEAKADIQKGLDFVHGKFIDAVAANRGLPRHTAAELSDGSTFFGEEAVRRGLADQVTTFTKFLAGLEAPAARPNQQPGGYAVDYGVTTMTLEEAMARIAELEEGQGADKAALAAAQARASDAETKVAALEAANASLSTSLAAAGDVGKALGEVLEANIRSMATALNAEVIIPDDLAGKQAYHAQIKEKFQAKFPAGGVAAVHLNPVGDAAEAEVPAWARQALKQTQEKYHG